MRKGILLLGTLILMAIVIAACSGEDDPVGPTNSAPGTPTIDALSGAPADGSTEVSLTPTLRWLASDPDGDALTYTVSFGITTPPPVVSTDQSGLSYAPASLAFSTKYYWSVTAKDPSGATRASGIWDFTTMATGSESVSAPDAPSGDAVGHTNASLTFSASGGLSSLGHDLEYKFDWGSGDFSAWVATSAMGIWTEAGTYDVKAQARCVDHPAVVSDWSAATSVTITVPGIEVVTTPGTPTGSGAAEEGESINFAVSASTSTEGHTVQYRWDFGDGGPTPWASDRSRPYAWATAGTYEVKAQARCGTHTDIESEWSAAKTVTITVPGVETVSTPNTPTGSASAQTGQSIGFSTGGSVSSDGHAVAYRYDWGDGTMSSWQSLATNNHAWSTAGTYEVKTQARCITHASIESAWSEAHSIVIFNPAEALDYNTRLVYGVVTEGQINESYEYSVSHSTNTNLSDPMEGQYDWGDGTTSAWVQFADRAQSHAWTTEGTYGIVYTGRCTVHHDFTFKTDTLWVTIVTEATETVSKPGYVNWQTSRKYPLLDTEIIYYAYGGISSLGHDTEVRFAWGDGDTTAWVAEGSNVTKTWTVPGTFEMTRQARCAAHTDIVSEWSDPVNIIPGPELVTTPEAPDGPTVGQTNEWLYYTARGSVSTWHSTWVEYRFDWGDGSALSDWGSGVDTTRSHKYTTVGDHEVKVQARCSWPSGHTNPESEWSSPTVVTVTESVSLNSGGATGPTMGAVNISYFFSKAGSAATTGAGHAVEYRFDFGDGSLSDWSSADSASHMYTAAGHLGVLVQARCADHTDAVSAWSTTAHYIDITDAVETITTPAVYTSTSPPYSVGNEIRVNIIYGESNYGDSIEYQVDWGDGTIDAWTLADWGGASYKWMISPTHTYSSMGTYDLVARGRCATHTSVESGWSAPNTKVVGEGLTKPGTPTGPASAPLSAIPTFTTTGSTSSEGHTVEYKFFYLHQSGSTIYYESPWSTSLSDTPLLTTARAYRVRVLARCATDTTVESVFSNLYPFTITP